VTNPTPTPDYIIMLEDLEKQWINASPSALGDAQLKRQMTNHFWEYRRELLALVRTLERERDEALFGQDHARKVAGDYQARFAAANQLLEAFYCEVSITTTPANIERHRGLREQYQTYLGLLKGDDPKEAQPSGQQQTQPGGTNHREESNA